MACGVVVGVPHRPFWLQCLLFDVSQPFLAVFLLLILVAQQLARGFLGLQCLRGCWLLLSQPFKAAVVAARVRHNIRSYELPVASKNVRMKSIVDL